MSDSGLFFGFLVLSRARFAGCHLFRAIKRTKVLVALIVALLSGAGWCECPKIVFDTDMIGDYDDVGAMAVLHALADAGECEILATVSSTHSNASVGTIEVVNRYYGRPDIPVGAVKGEGVGGGSEVPERRSHLKYELLLKKYPGWFRFRNANDSPDATEVYRRVLAAQPDGSVTVVTTGFLTNLRKLLQSKPDAISPLDGRALVKAKVRVCYVMGGKVPQGREFNLFNDPQSAKFVFANWPVPLVVNDFWFGTYIYAGRKVAGLPEARNPVRDIYAMCLPAADGCPSASEIIPTRRFKDNVKEGHNCFDQSCVLAAVRGPGSFFRIVRGKMEMVGEHGDNVWTEEPNGPHAVMAFVDAWPRERIAAVIDDLMARPPALGQRRASAVDFVNPMIGTKGAGHVFPGPCRPFGLVQPSPDTGNGSWKYCSGYAYEDRVIRRFSQTHLNGTGQAGLGDVGFLPFAGDPSDDLESLTAPFEKKEEKSEPGKYAVRLADGTHVEIAAGCRLAHYRISFPKGKKGGLFFDFSYGLYRQDDYLPLLTTTSSVVRVGSHRLEGLNHSEVFAPRDIAFVVDLNPTPSVIRELPRLPGSRGPQALVEFQSDVQVEVKIALSTRSIEGARKNFAAECDVAFDRRVEETREEWGRYLSRIDLSGLSDEERVSASTALYHLLVQPNLISDIGEPVRYSTFSFWDTFRDAHPLYEQLVPERVNDFILSLLDHFELWGYLPRWELWGRETNCMIGSHAIPVIVSAYQHGFRGYDVEKAYAAVRATLTGETRPGSGKVYPRRTDWAILDRYGYFPFDLVSRESVSRTLECSFDDSCAATFARALGKAADADFFERRSWGFTNLFDRTTLCFRGKDSKGNWRTPFDPADAASTPDYTEGSALQYSWHVLHRPDWIVKAMGGSAAMVLRLDAFFAGTLCPDSPRHYSQDITGLIGDYAHGNEPCHHVTGLYRLVGQPDKAAALDARILHDFYRPTPDGLCGNDDCGQMSAWYLRRLRDCQIRSSSAR